jgi:D-alanine-D-alanine ligase
MDKEFTKKLLRAEGLPVGPYAVVRAGAGLSTADRERLGLPVFVKPARGGSSIGITRVTDWSEVDGAIATARQSDPKVLVEAAIEGGRELECGVLQRPDGGADASVVAEITGYGEHEFYDFEAKYLGEEGVTLQVPASLRPDVVEAVQRLSVTAFKAVGGEGLARVGDRTTDEK